MSKTQTYVPISKTEKQLRYLVWAYILLLILEGALRKWFLPQLSDALLLCRDPIILLSYAIAIKEGIFPINRYVISLWLLIGLCFALSVLFCHGNLFVAGFGFRVAALHIPFAFIIGKVLHRQDVISIGRWWLWGCLPMTALIVMQFYSPQSAWVNLSVGGSEGAGFSGALGRYRPPGTFSFIVGIIWFYTFAAAFLVSGITQHKRYSRLLLTLSSFAIVVAVPVSISRSLILAAGLTFVVGLSSSIFQKNALVRYARVALIAGIALFIANQLTVFDDAKEAFFSRWESSTGEKRGGVKKAIIGRVIEEFTEPFTETNDIPILGEGLGAGTLVGVKVLSDKRYFALGESEWHRLIGESGLLFGTLFIAWRVWLTVRLSMASITAFRKGNALGLILLSATAYNLLVGQLGQTTIHGFTIIGIGLTIASMRPRKIITQVTNAPTESNA